MYKLSKIAILILTYFCLQIFFLSCCLSGNDCENYNCEIVSISSSHRDNSGVTGVLVQNDTVAVSSYILSAHYHLVNQVCCISSPPIVNSCYATGFCDCDDEVYLVNPITQIRISSLNNFNDSLPAKSKLNDMFKSMSVIEINERMGWGISSEDFIHDFYMIHPPTVDLSHQFIIDILLEDGTHFVDTTSVINFTL